MDHFIQQLKELYELEETAPSVSYSILEIETMLQAYFKQFFEHDFVDQCFEIPADFKAYLMALDGRLGKKFTAFRLDGKSFILGTTKSSLSVAIEDAALRRQVGDAYSTDTFWLCFGIWGDKHEFLICCDKTHPDFGKVFDAYDDHPYYSEDFLTGDEWDNIEAFLMHYINEEE